MFPEPEPAFLRYGQHSEWSEADLLYIHAPVSYTHLEAEEKAKQEAEKKAEEERIKAEQEAAVKAEEERIAAEQAQAQQQTQETSVQVQENNDPIVYITNSGDKYHTGSCLSLIHISSSVLNKLFISCCSGFIAFKKDVIFSLSSSLPSS